jgi:multiple antibiotic resistance protein
MEDIPHALIPFLAVLNPFALCLYLAEPMEDMHLRAFIRVVAGACGISLAVFSLFALTGEYLLRAWLGVHPAALRAFGGVIFLIVGYNYVVKGYRAATILRGSLDELPSAIALPFMVGAGTITQSILIGKQLAPLLSVATLAVGIAAAFLIVLLFKLIREHMRGQRERLFDRYVNILARINGLLIGAISVDMIVSALHALWLRGS